MLVLRGSCILISVGHCGCKERTAGHPDRICRKPSFLRSLIGVVSVFMKIINTGKPMTLLVAPARNCRATITELHDIQDGKMVKVESMPSRPTASVVLRPARHHIMILNYRRTSKEGSPVLPGPDFQMIRRKKTSLLEVTTFCPSRRTVA